MLCAVLFIVVGLMGLIKKALKQQEWTEFSWRNKVYNAKSSVETRLDNGFTFEYTYFQWL